jgi:hypothetical protein
MGTNYYLRKHNVASPPCPTCGHQPNDDTEDELHIGKSSGGWNFALRIYPKIDGTQPYCLAPFGVTEIAELDDWRPLFERFRIFDEYDHEVTTAEMISTITERSCHRPLISRVTGRPDDTFRGKGTYDLCNFEFS